MDTMESPLSCSMGSFLLYGLTFLVVVAFWMKRGSVEKTNRLPPGPKGWPFFGNFFDFIFTKLEASQLLHYWANKYGDIFMYRLMGSRFVLLNSVDIIHEAYVSGPHAYDRIPILPCNKAIGRPNTDLGIIGCAGNRDWRLLRGLVHNILRNVKSSDAHFEDLVTSQAARFLSEVSRHHGSSFDPQDATYVTIANIAATIVFGKTYEYENKDFVNLIKLNRDVMDYMGKVTSNYHIPVFASLPIESNRKGYRAVGKMFQFITKTIQQHRENLESEHKSTIQEEHSVIRAFLKEQKIREKRGESHPFTDSNLSQIIFDLCLASFDTVSSSLYWIYRILASHHDVQTKIQAEIDNVVGRDRMPQLSDSANLPYTMATIAECYRVSRMIPAQLPHVVNEDCHIGGYHIPKGTFVSVHSAYLALSQDLWKESDVFNPERFVDATGKFDVSMENKMMKFGAGRRICVGEQLARTELFILTSHVLHRFTLQEVTPFTMGCTEGLVNPPLPYQIQATPRP